MRQKKINVWQVRRSQPDKPIHSPRDSLISATSEFQNYEGIVNWAFLLLAIGGLRLGLENVNKYGVLSNSMGQQNILSHVVSKNSLLLLCPDSLVQDDIFLPLFNEYLNIFRNINTIEYLFRFG